jgi:hypothetical protein
MSYFLVRRYPRLALVSSGFAFAVVIFVWVHLLFNIPKLVSVLVAGVFCFFYELFVYKFFFQDKKK